MDVGFNLKFLLESRIQRIIKSISREKNESNVKNARVGYYSDNNWDNVWGDTFQIVSDRGREQEIEILESYVRRLSSEKQRKSRK